MEKVCFWNNWNGVDWRKSVLARLEWLGMEEVRFGPTVMAWNGESPVCNALRKKLSYLRAAW
jgi:hypothetical protein